MYLLINRMRVECVHSKYSVMYLLQELFTRAGLLYSPSRRLTRTLHVLPCLLVSLLISLIDCMDQVVYSG